MEQRQILLDTETTGLESSQGHRIIEIGCVELINRRWTGRHFHYYLNPDREIEKGALAVHGITQEFLADKPRFAEIAPELLQFIQGAELIIHNAPFDIGFLEHELRLMGSDFGKITEQCSVIDTLTLARKMHPGQKNNLDALCKRYNVNNIDRSLHGALLDAKILGQVYLAMTGGQGRLFDEGQGDEQNNKRKKIKAKIQFEQGSVRVLKATSEEIIAHQAYLTMISKKAEGECVWLSS